MIGVMRGYPITFMEAESLPACLGIFTFSCVKLMARLKPLTRSLISLAFLKLLLEDVRSSKQITWSLRSQTRPQQVWGRRCAGALGMHRCLIWPPRGPTNASACQQSAQLSAKSLPCLKTG